MCVGKGIDLPEMKMTGNRFQRKKSESIWRVVDGYYRNINWPYSCTFSIRSNTLIDSFLYQGGSLYNYGHVISFYLSKDGSVLGSKISQNKRGASLR